MWPVLCLVLCGQIGSDVETGTKLIYFQKSISKITISISEGVLTVLSSYYAPNSWNYLNIYILASPWQLLSTTI